jgi:transcriptional regulator with XRE-family HTH domain
MSGTVHVVTGHVKYGDLSAQELSRLARFREMAERQLVNLGAAIEDARKAKGWSRSTLAKQIPVEEKTVERWEKGKTGGAMDSLETIAKALDTSSDDLLAAAAAKGKQASDEAGSDLMEEFSERSADGKLAREVADLRKEVSGIAGELEAAVGLLQTLATDLKSVQGDLATLKRRKAG